MSEAPSKSRSLVNLLSRLDAHHRFIASVAVATIVYICFFGHMQWGKHLILSWDAFTLCLLSLAWARIVTAQPRVVLKTARLQHSTRKWIFVIVLGAACASLAAVFFLLRPEQHLSSSKSGEHLALALALATVLLSWTLIHTIFALQYAYLYYCRHTAGGASGTALLFPGEKLEPDYYDFAYFSFVIGMTSQVSDVQIVSREIRRWALLHGVVSFAFNTAVLALGINIVSNLF